MSLARLLFDLKPLIADPAANFARIATLLEQNNEMAEYEVARFYVVKSLTAELNTRLRSWDPQDRFEAVRIILTTCPRSMAAKLLRRVVKDPDPKTRSFARHAVRKLGLADVGVPDTRIELYPGQKITPSTPGGWNPTGWSFGLFSYRGYQPLRTDQLGQHNLPVLQNDEEIATLVGLSDASELKALMRPGATFGAYVEFDIDKAKGGKRRIAAPRAPLKRVQRLINEEILQKLPMHDACHGFVHGRSTVTNAAPHEGAKLVIKLDLFDFFPTVHYRRVSGLFMGFGYGNEVAQTLAALTTYRPMLPGNRVGWPGHLPQGAPTSPMLANLAARRLDARLAGLAKKNNARYTRYADDMTFSFHGGEPEKIGRFIWWVDQICQQEGFYENPAKRKILRASNQQRVTGIVVNSGLFVPREDRRRFRAILHNCRKHGVDSQARDKKDFAAYLRGFASYVKMVQPDLGQRLVNEVEEILS